MPACLKNWLIGMSKFKHPELRIYSWFRVGVVWVVCCRNNERKQLQMK